MYFEALSIYRPEGDVSRMLKAMYLSLLKPQEDEAEEEEAEAKEGAGPEAAGAGLEALEAFDVGRAVAFVAGVLAAVRVFLGIFAHV